MAEKVGMTMMLPSPTKQQPTPQIKKALGIASVQTVEFSWRAEATDEYPGAQIDLVIRRADRIVNLCEMKFCIAEYLIDKSDDASIRNKIATYQRLTRCKVTSCTKKDKRHLWPYTWQEFVCLSAMQER